MYHHQEYIIMNNQDDNKSAYIIAYGLVATSGFILGLICGSLLSYL